MATRADQDSNLNSLINAGIREGGGVEFDIVPVQNSANGITSGGMYSTLRDSNIGFVDDEPTDGSENLVKSGGVKRQLNRIEESIFPLNINIPLTFNLLWSTVNGNSYLNTANRIGSSEKFSIIDTDEISLVQTQSGVFRFLNIICYDSTGTFIAGISIAQTNPLKYNFKGSDIIALHPYTRIISFTISKYDPSDTIDESEMSDLYVKFINNDCIEKRLEKLEEDSTVNLVGSKICATGDSIMAGAENDSTVLSFAKIIADKYGMSLQNIAVGGGSIVNLQGRFNIPDSLSNLDSDGDYYLFDGGVNDSSLNITLGAVTDDFDVANLDLTTFAGAFEKFLYNIVTVLAGKKVLFVIVHKMTSYYTGIYYHTDFYTVSKQALEKWGVPYVDINAEIPPIRYIDSLKNTYTRNQDGWHPNALCYRTFYVPKIIDKMKSL